MLKTKPKWMRWNSLSNAQKKNNVVDADTPPVDTNEDEGADVLSASSDSNSHKQPKKVKPKDKPKTKRSNVNKKYEFKLPNDVLKSGEFSLNMKINDIGGIAGKRSAKSSIVRTKRTSNYTSETLSSNREDMKYYRRKGSSWKLNKKPERSAFSYDALHNRKLGSTLALLFSKIAEERMGDKIIGEDKWDVEDIMFRRVSKKVITNCKYTREKKHLILILDRSPSCKDMAQTYSEIATESAMFDDIEIFDAPNGYAHSIYNPLRKDFINLTDEEIDAMYHWNSLQDRTIIYFGDEDAVRSINNSNKHNEIHWFYKSYTSYDKDREYKDLIDKYKDRKNITIYKCNNTEELMEAVRSMK